MIIGFIKEIIKQEKRVALTPDVCKLLLERGHQLIMQKGAGVGAGFDDDAYIGVKILASAQDVFASADLLIKIWQPSQEESRYFKKNQVVVAIFEDHKELAVYEKLDMSCYALNLMPRISRAQNMDVLSSQSNLAGYKAVISACDELSIAVPLMMTSAGTVAPAKFFVLGIGVAGLQAIATAKRLGAVVFASDIRDETIDQAQSLGAKFVAPEQLLEKLFSIDVLLTSIPLSEEIKQALPSHCLVKSFIEGNFASDVAKSASFLYAKNIYNFLGLDFDINDEIVAKTCLLRSGSK